jgi:hypothetical protein
LPNKLSGFSGRAKDIGVGENGQMWAIGTNKEAAGFGIYKYNAKTRKYKKVPGSGTDISVDKAGHPWVVNVKKNVYSHNGKRCTKQAFNALRDRSSSLILLLARVFIASLWVEESWISEFTIVVLTNHGSLSSLSYLDEVSKILGLSPSFLSSL